MSSHDDGYGYGWDDDPMGNDWNALPSVRPGPVRTTLIRDHAHDEEEARREALRARFQVGENGGLAGGAKGPNAVSEAEFSKIFSMYEHIYDGDANLKIDTKGLGDDAGKYKDSVMENIARMLQTPTGRKELEYLTYGYKDENGKHVDKLTTIMAGADKNNNGSRLDDYAAQADATDNVAADLRTDLKGKVLGRSTGSSSVVQYNPNVMPDGFRSDVVLAHELTHSLTQILGLQDATTVGPEDGVPKDVSGTRPLDRAEHQAAGLGKYHDGAWSWLPIDERRYIADRNAMNGAGEVAGDHEMRPRESYRR